MANREYVIVSDTTTDMGKEYYTENNISLLYFHYIMDDEEHIQYTESDLGVKEFYDRVRAGSMPKTSQVAYEEVFNLFERIAKHGMDIFCLSFSGALSGSCQTICMAANDIMGKYPECTVKVVDSISACGGEGLLLDYCVKRRNQGADLDELVEYAEVIKYNTINLFTVIDLNHLHRGGRLSKASAVFGTMLGIKPVFTSMTRGNSSHTQR